MRPIVVNHDRPDVNEEAFRLRRIGERYGIDVVDVELMPRHGVTKKARERDPRPATRRGLHRRRNGWESAA